MMMRNQEPDKEKFTPRAYQVELIDIAKKENLIVPLGTGTGKTFIAVMLIKELSGEVRPSLADGGKRSIFLTDSVALVGQQAEHIRGCTDLTVGEYHGQMKVELWSKEVWLKHIDENQVLVMTAQVFLDILAHSYWSLDRVNLIVFDECHKALSSGSKQSFHAYRKIMTDHYTKLADQIGTRKCPRILGLTASVVNESVPVTKLEEHMSELERIYHSKLETASEITDVLRYAAKPQVVVHLCDDFNWNSGPMAEAEQLLSNVCGFTKKAQQHFFHSDFDSDCCTVVLENLKRTSSILRQLGPWCAMRLAQTLRKKVASYERLAVSDWQLYFLKLLRTTLHTVKCLLERSFGPMVTVEDLLRVTPHRFAALLAKLKDIGANPEDAAGFSGLIFVRERYVALVFQILMKQVQKMDRESYGYLNLDYIVGYSGHKLPQDEVQSLMKRQEDVMRRFRQNQLNLLISTSVLEEGIDVRQCNYVMRFDPPENYRAYVQSKGRARKKGSKFVIFVENRNREEQIRKLNQYNEIEKFLLRHCKNRSAPTKEEIDVEHADRQLPPYRPSLPPDMERMGRQPPQVTMTSAIQLVNRYCQRLPSDIFTRLVPDIRVVEKLPAEHARDGTARWFYAVIRLPINSPVKQEIFGKPMTNKKYARMAAALECCKVLHQRKELDDHLLPVGKESMRVFLQQDADDEAFPTDGKPLPGSSKRKQFYDKKVSDTLLNCRPKPGVPTYLHLITLERRANTNCTSDALSHQAPDDAQIAPTNATSLCNGYRDGDNNELMLNGDVKPTDRRQFAIMSTKPLPPALPAFPLYPRQGEVLASVHTLPAKTNGGGQSTVMSLPELQVCVQFHMYLFSHLLALDKCNMRFGYDEAPNSVLVVPVVCDDDNENDVWRVDIEFVKSVVEVMHLIPRKPKEEVRESFVFRPEDYLNKMVVPWYRNREQPQYYCVSRILSDMTPASPFPDTNYGSFNDYFFVKYGYQIYQRDQPLLDVDYTTTRWNILTRAPKRKKPRLEEAEQPKDKEESMFGITQKQILVPELVDIHPISGQLWNQIVCLPSVLYRLNCLLLADELRERIQVEAFPELPSRVESSSSGSGHYWDPLDYGWNKNLEDYLRFKGVIPAEEEEEGEDNHPSNNNNNSRKSGRYPHHPHRAPKSKQPVPPPPEEPMPLGDAGSFVIDQWDPTEADGIDPGVLQRAPELPPSLTMLDMLPGDSTSVFQALDSLPVSAVPRGPGAVDAVSVAPRLTRAEEEEDLFDQEINRAEGMFKIVSFQLKEREQNEMLSHMPDPDSIEPSGWDNDEPGLGAAALLEAGDAPIQYISFGNDPGVAERLDGSAFLQEIARQDVTGPAVRNRGNGFVPMHIPSEAGSSRPQAERRPAYHPNDDDLMRLDEEPPPPTRPLTSSKAAPSLIDSDIIVDFQQHSAQQNQEQVAVTVGLPPLQHCLLSDSFDDSDRQPTEDVLRFPKLEAEALKPEVLYSRPRTPDLISFDEEGREGVLLLNHRDPGSLESSVCSQSISNEISSSDLLASELARSNAEFRTERHNEGIVGGYLTSFELDTTEQSPCGPNPALVLQALTMCSASDGINLERLETVGDSFLKYSTTVALFLEYADKHEGKLSFLRSKYVSNYNLYKLGKRKKLGDSMVGVKFDPSDNWLPPCYVAIERKHENASNVDKDDEAMELEIEGKLRYDGALVDSQETSDLIRWDLANPQFAYNLLSQQSIPDKSIADSVEALIGVYLITYGPIGAMRMMRWLGINVLPKEEGSYFAPPPSPLLRFIPDPDQELRRMYFDKNLREVEGIIGYSFRDKAYVVQAFTHASYYYNRITDCYQRLEFLGDAVLDYLITRHLFEDPRRHSPGVLTDLRSALVNNTIFASLAVKYRFHHYFMALCPGLFRLVGEFVRMQKERAEDVNFHEELYFNDEEGCEDEEDVEVPKSMGDVFESIAGAVYLDSGYSLDTVWRVYYGLMKEQIEKCSENPPRSPIRELLEMKPERVRFAKPERLVTEGKVKVVVDVEGTGRYTGIGRNYRTAKATAAKRAVRDLKRLQKEAQGKS